MATFVDVCTEEEQVAALIEYVHALKLKKGGGGGEGGASSKWLQLQQEGNNAGVVSSLIAEHESVFSDTNDKEIEACMNVISATIKKLEPDVAAKLVDQLKDAVVSNVSDRPILRLRILTNIYHAFDRNAAARYDIFTAIVNFAADSGNAELVIPKLKQIDQWLVDWRASPDQSSKLYKLAHKILAANNRSLQAHELITKYLQTFNNDLKSGTVPAATTADLADSAAAAAREAIASDDIYQCDHLFSLEAVKLLERHPQHGVLYQLLQIFANEKLDSFQAFQARNPGFLASVGLSEEGCLRKIRLLSLASLAAENSEIPYAVVANTLNINEDEVEGWVIDAVSAKLVEAKMNQLKKVITVSYCIQRTFTTAQWLQLSTKLNKWKGSVHRLLDIIQQVKRRSDCRGESQC